MITSTSDARITCNTSGLLSFHSIFFSCVRVAWWDIIKIFGLFYDAYNTYSYKHYSYLPPSTDWHTVFLSFCLFEDQKWLIDFFKYKIETSLQWIRIWNVLFDSKYISYCLILSRLSVYQFQLVIPLYRDTIDYYQSFSIIERCDVNWKIQSIKEWVLIAVILII